MTDSSDTEKNQDFLRTGDVLAQCPHCDRFEKFDNVPTARAWTTSHILEAHSDELPDTEVQR